MVGVLTASLPKRGKTMSNIKRKRVQISSQRQFTILKEFFDALNFKEEAFIEFNVKSKQLSIKPADRDIVDFSADILRNLQQRGYTGEELVNKFIEVKSRIPNALEQMKQEALNGSELTNQSLDEFLDSLEDELYDDE